MAEQVMQAVHMRDVRQALDECTRELNVRRRCFPRWIDDGRVSATDAQDRLDRLATACELLKQMLPAEKVNKADAAPAT